MKASWCYKTNKRLDGCRLTIKAIPKEFSVCKLSNASEIPVNDEFCFVAKTDEELSLVCSTDHVPEHTVKRDDGWRAFRIEGVLDFSFIGILAKIFTILSQNKISIFAVSTYNTDYILTKREHFEKALSILKAAGYDII